MRVPYERIVHYVFHHHIGIILLSTLLSVGSGFFAVQLDLKADSADLLPDGLRQRQRAQSHQSPRRRPGPAHGCDHR